MASRDMACACKAEVSESPVVKNIDQERLKSVYHCSVSVLEHERGGQDKDPYTKYD